MSDYDPEIYVNPSRNKKTSKYDREELSIIKPYKERYLAAPSPAARRQIIVGELCVELFNFWVISCRASFSSFEKEHRVEVRCLKYK